jgi:hypothetical protein
MTENKPFTYVQRERVLATTEYRTPTEHYEEFIKITDSLGRVWDAIKHPRDHLGRFIRTFSDIKFSMPGEHGAGTGYSGRVLGVDKDGTLHAEVSGVAPGAAPGGPQVGDVVRLNNDDVEVQTIKARLGGKGAAGQLNTQEHDVVANQVDTLRRLEMNQEADELQEILDVSMEKPNPKDPASQARKDDAIDRYRALGEKLDNIRGEGFKDGQSVDDVKGELSPEDRDRLNALGTVIDATFTARHSLGDKTVPETSSEGPVKAKQSEVRLGIAQNKLKQNFDTGKQLWDATGATLTKSQLAQPEAPQVLDAARENAEPDQNVYGKLVRSSFAKLRSGLDRAAGYKQQQRAAPGARYHVDANGDEVIVGTTVNVAANKQTGREAYTGMVMHIAYDKQSGKTVMKVREFDPEYKYGNTTTEGKVLPYKDRRGIPSKSIEIADDESQNTMFTNLALQGKTELITAMSDALAEDTIAKLQAEAGRRYAETGAKRTSPTGAVDAVPIHARIKSDMNGEQIGIGDQVLGPNGLPGTVTYMEPNSNTVKIMYPSGQFSPRMTAKKLQKLHGPSSEVFPGGEGGHADKGYVPTRDEAAQDAEDVGASQVAEAIRGGGDSAAIQQAMAADPAFQDVMGKADDLYDREAQALSTGGEPDAADQEELARLNRFAAASIADFREGDAPTISEPISPPTPESETERPQNPANSEQVVDPKGVTVREEGDSTVVDENVEDPIPTSDTEAVDQAIEQASAEKGGEPQAPAEQPAGPQSLADKVHSDITKLVGEAKNSPNVNGAQRAQLDKWLGELDAAMEAKDGPGVVQALQGMTKAVNLSVNKPLHGTKLRQVLNRAAMKDGQPVTLANLVQDRLDAGADIFGGAPAQRTDRVPEAPNETPEGVDPKVDALDATVSDGLMADDGSVKVMRGDQEVNEGFYVVDQDTVTEFDAQPTEQELADFLTQTQSSNQSDVSLWYDDTDGTWRLARVQVYDTEEEAAGAAETGGSNQYVNIADGSVMNLAIDGDPNMPPEAVEDPRSEERRVRTAGKGKASSRSTSKQKQMLDHVAETSGDADLGRIATAIKNGEEISGADASRLADAIDGMGADQFDKPSDKGVASQMAHRLARAAGEEGARGYSSQNTALRRTSDVGISLSAMSQDDNIRGLVDGARTDIKNGDNQAASEKFRQAADAFDALGLPNGAPATRAREHADRLDAMGGVTGPAAEAPAGEVPTGEAPPPPEPPAPPGAPDGAGGPGLPEVESALGSVDNAIDTEVQAETDSGRPQGETDAVDEARAQLGLIRGRVTDEGPYTELADDLRKLAQHMEDSWTGSDPGPTVQELRDTADGLDGGPTPPAEAAPAAEGETPGEAGGGPQPFRADDPAGLHAALVDQQRNDDLIASEDKYLAESLRGYQKLLGQVEEGSLAYDELNGAKFEALRKVNAASAIRENLASKIARGALTPDGVAKELEYLDEDAQPILDVWNGTAPLATSADTLEDFVKQRVDGKAEAARVEASQAADSQDPFGLRFMRAQLEMSGGAARNERNEVRNLSDFHDLTVEMASILNVVQSLRDPQVRAGLRPDQLHDIPQMVSRLESDYVQANKFFDEAADQGVDVGALNAVLREQLDKFGAADLLDYAHNLPPEAVGATNRAAKAYRLKMDTGKPAITEATALLTAMRDLLKEADVPFAHRTLAPAAAKVLTEQMGANGGVVPDPLRKVLADPVFQRFGAFSGALGRMDIDDMVKNGDIDSLNEATGGRYAAVEWQDAPQISADLVSDDRQGESSVEADIAWKDGLDQVTPNVAAALNSLFSSMGGGIHRVRSDITQAQTPAAERWKADGWARAGADVRTPDQVEGVYSKDDNLVVVADSRSIADTGTGSHVLVHELGHSLDSMLGELLGEGGWFTEMDPGFKRFHEGIKKNASYGKDPEQSLMFWYFRDANEGAVKHNGSAGHKEVFAEGYAAYAAGLKRLQEMPEGSGPITEETTYALIGRQLTGDRGQLVEWAGDLSFEQVREREVAIGHAIMDYFGDLEENQLPKIMATPKAIPVQSALRSAVLGLEQSAASSAPTQRMATPSQREKVDSHNSVKHGRHEMTHIEPGTPEWEAKLAEIKAFSPGAALPPPSAIYVTFNPFYQEQGEAIIWKAVMPNKVDWSGEYTDQHKETQLAAKFQRQQRVDKALNKAHAKAQAEAAYDETAALVLAMIETGMRVGSSERAGSTDKKTGKNVKTFGGATMQAKHVFFPSETLMRFRFPGKAGVMNTYESRNPELRAAVKQLLEGKGPSDQVFANTNSGRSIDYLRAATGVDDIINHDTRTRYATNMARALVSRYPKTKLPKNEAALKKVQTEISKKVGLAINDTWQVAQKSYISPAAWRRLEESAGVPQEFDDSPPYGLVEGDVVQSIGGPPVEGGAPAEGSGAPPAPVAAAMTRNRYGDFAPVDAPLHTKPQGTAEEPAEPAPEEGGEEPETFVLEHTPEAIAEREDWYAAHVWPAPPLVAGPDPEFPDETEVE